MPRPRSIGVFVLGLSALLFVFSVFFMSRRVAAQHRDFPPPNFAFQKTSERGFDYKGRDVAFADALTPEGQAALSVTYGDESILLPIHPPHVRDLPDLRGYDEWLAVLQYAATREGDYAGVDWGTGAGIEMVLVKRNTPPGMDQDTWGSVFVRDWTFDFIQFNADGTFTRREMQFPAFSRYRNETYLPALKADPQSKVEMIMERSWEWQAALFAVPKAQISRYRFRNTAVSAMGWTLPVAAASALGVLGGIGLLMAAATHRPPPAPLPPTRRGL